MFFYRQLKNSGSILVIATWFLVILAIFGFGLARMTLAENNFAAYLENRLFINSSIYALAEAVIWDKMLDADMTTDSMAELARNEEVEFAPAKIIYSLYDEESKVNINTAPSSVLKKLPGMNFSRAVSIVNSEMKPFFAKEQLLMINGLDLEDYMEIMDYITVYGSGQININTCGNEILEALGFSESFIYTINQFREGSFFDSTNGIVDTLEEFGSIALSDQQNIVSAVSKNLIGVYSRYYNIKADVILREKSAATFDIIFQKKKGKIERWQEQ